MVPGHDLAEPEYTFGWVIPIAGECTLALLLRPTFPFSLPRIKILDPEEAKKGPHIEARGFLCLVANATYDHADPVGVVAALVDRARSLLKENKVSRHEKDFLIDFEAYWRRDASPDARKLLCLIDQTDRSRSVVTYASTKSVYVFESTERAKSWWRHRWDEEIKGLAAAAVLRLQSIPAPSDFPATGGDFAKLVAKRCADADKVLRPIALKLQQSIPIVLVATSPSENRQRVGVLLEKPHENLPPGKKSAGDLERGFRPGRTPLWLLLGRYRVRRVDLSQLDAASTRLPRPVQNRLAEARVAIVGCGSLGAGVAQFLVQSGVGFLKLIDNERLGWENIGRHVLGANDVGNFKAEALTRHLCATFPQVKSIAGISKSIQEALFDNPAFLDDSDLVISATGDWSADLAVEAHLRSRREARFATLYGWMETNACAAHALLCPRDGPHFSEGFDAFGAPILTATVSTLPPPPECGAGASQYGSIELANSQALVAGLALAALLAETSGTVWRTWLAREEYLDSVGSVWNDAWKETRGVPSKGGVVVAGNWPK